MDQATGDPVPMPRPVRQSTGNSNAGGGDDWGALGRKYLRVVDVFEDIRHVVGSGYNIEQANGKIEIHTNDADEREAEKEAER